MFRTMRSALSARRVPSIRFWYSVSALRAEATHFPPGVVAASDALDTERKELKAEREELKKLLTPSMDKDLEIAIHNRIASLGNQIAALMGRLPPVLPARPLQQPAVPTTNSGETTLCSRRWGKRCSDEVSEDVGDQEFESVEMFMQRVNERRFDEALISFDKWVLHMPRDPDDPYCAPHKVESSWGAKEWSEALEEGRKQLTGLNDGASSRDRRILGIYAGTGCGKTHALLDAKTRLNGDTGIYITYNLEQLLSFDREFPHIAVLLRVLLRHAAFDVSNRTCDCAFSRHAQVLAHIGPLDDFVVWYFSKPRIENEAKPKHVVVCVDEVRRLMNGTDNSVVQVVTSALGKLAFALEKRACDMHSDCVGTHGRRVFHCHWKTCTSDFSAVAMRLPLEILL